MVSSPNELSRLPIIGNGLHRCHPEENNGIIDTQIRY